MPPVSGRSNGGASPEAVAIISEDCNVVATPTDRARLRAEAFDPAQDLYAAFRSVREAYPVWRSPWGDIYLSSYGLVDAALADRRLRSAPSNMLALAAADDRPALSQWLLHLEGETHASIRQAMRQGLLALLAGPLQRIVEIEVERALAPIGPGEIDVVAAFTRDVPERVICAMVGVPEEDAPRLRAWSIAARAILDSDFGSAFVAKGGSIDEMSDYFTDQLQRGESPAGSIQTLPGMREYVEREGAVLAGRNLAFFAFAGHETTVHLIGSMLMLLSRSPDLWAAVRANPRLVPRLVDETLRLESPVQKLARWAAADVTIGGMAIARGASLVLLVGAANRDPARFPDPDRCDLHREIGGHLGFGRGSHFCLGSALARLEAECVLHHLAQRFRRIEAVPGGSRWLGNSSFRGLAELRLVLS